MNPAPSLPARSRPLLKILGVGFGISVTIGGTIGTGILRKPGLIADNLRSPVWIMGVWALVGLYALLGTLCVIELGVMVPRAGGWYPFARRAFGNYVGFIIGWSSWLGSAAGMAFSAYTMCEYIALLLPATTNYVPTMAVATLLVFAVFHWIGLKTASRAQEIMSFVKAVGLFGLVAVCFIFGGGEGIARPVVTTISPEKPFLLGLITALQAIFYTYDGWHTAAYFAEENTNPAKTLPRSMVSGTLLIITIYLLVNLALLYVMPLDQLAQSKLPAADAVRLIFGERSGQLITLLLLISVLGIINAQIMFNPRVLYALSRDGLFLKQGTYVNAGGTPGTAMLLTAGMSILLIVSGTYARLSDIATFFFVLCNGSGMAALLRLRQTEPDLPRPYKVWGYPLVPWAVLVASAAFLAGAVWGDPNSSAYALGFLVLSYPLYRLVAR
ncbi:MAG: amino acid permease [Bacteroidetes bacterium]|nr:amino acid permease [Fibrella sp.]